MFTIYIIFIFIYTMRIKDKGEQAVSYFIRIMFFHSLLSISVKTHFFDRFSSG